MKKETFIALLKAMGVPSDHIKWIEDNWDKADAQIDQAKIIADFEAAQKSIYEQDPDIVSAIDKRVKGREKDIAERLLKKAFGLSSEETKDKDFGAIVELAKTKALTSSNKTTEELQVKNLELENKIKKLEEEDIPSIKATVENEKKQLKIERDFEKTAQDIVKDITAKNPNALRVPFETAIRTTKILLADKYKFDYDDKGEMVIVDKETGLKIKNGTAFLTPKDAVMNNWKENQYIAESNADTPPPKPPANGTPPSSGGGIQQPNEDEQEQLYKKFPHLKKAVAHVEKIKEASTPPPAK